MTGSQARALRMTRRSLELLDPGQHVQIFVAAQMRVVSVGVPGVEGMEANHVQALRSSRLKDVAAFLRPLSVCLIYLFWDGAVVELHHLVEILCRQQRRGQVGQKVRQGIRLDVNISLLCHSWLKR